MNNSREFAEYVFRIGRVIMMTPQHAQIDQRLKQPAHGDLRSLLSQIRGSNPRNRTRFHDRGMVLFAEADPARGVYVLRTGSAAVSISSSEGRVVILRVAHAGEPTLAPCCIDFISGAE